MNAVTHAIIFATMAVDLGDLTETTLPEFWSRLKTYEQVRGTLLQSQSGPVPITLNDLRAHIGLHTNVFRVTTTKWVKRIITDNALRDAVREAEQFLAKPPENDVKSSSDA
jgi:hypothetical protein